MMKKLLCITLMVVITCTSSFAQLTVLLNFDGTTNGSYPRGSLISDGTLLYGMTVQGGINDDGTIFKIMPDGSGYVKLLDFADTAKGRSPRGSLISDGTFLYGMTRSGGTNYNGTIFKIMPDGNGFVKLLDFAGTTNGSNPYGSLISDGTYLYGMTEDGGVNDLGTLFKIMPDGSGYVKLLDFAGTTNGSNPFGSLISDGTFLYGMTYIGGTNDYGTIFKIMPDGSGYVKLLDFAGTTNGWGPRGSLISDGTYLYGMTTEGGVNDLGTLFKIMPDGSGYVKLLDFAGATNGEIPYGSLISEGTLLYGMTFEGGTDNYGTLFKIMPDGSGYVKLLDFTGANGKIPFGSLFYDGTFLYGMGEQGGTNDVGVMFKYALATNIQNTDVLQSWSVFPNPASGKSFINFSLSTRATVRVELYDVLGNKLKQLINADEDAGEHNASFDAGKLASGVYLLQIHAGDQMQSQKIVVMN